MGSRCKNFVGFKVGNLKKHKDIGSTTKVAEVIDSKAYPGEGKTLSQDAER